MKLYTKWDGYKHYKTKKEAQTAAREMGKRKKKITEILTLDENGNIITMYELAYMHIL